LIAILTTNWIAPIHIEPSAAFLKSIGLQPKPFAPILNFAYAAVSSISFLAIFKNFSRIFLSFLLIEETPVAVAG
jgi:hypothetical protein